MTKTKQTIYKLLARLPLTVTLISFFFLPDEVPVHFNFNNQVDRWGSKYELLILPFIIMFLGIIFLLIANHLDKKEKDGSNNYNILVTTGICILAMFNVLTYFTLYIAFAGVQDLSAAPIDILSITAFMLGIFLVIIGNIIPKAKMNSMLGLRTKWSMSSEEAWRKSQRFGGYTAIISGVLIIVESLIFSEMTAIYVLLGIIVIMAIVDTVYSYFASK